MPCIPAIDRPGHKGRRPVISYTASYPDILTAVDYGARAETNCIVSGQNRRWDRAVLAGYRPGNADLDRRPGQSNVVFVYDDSYGNLFATADWRCPMTLFEARERAFEQMFVHDEEARFRALARRNKLLGQWAATQIGLSGAKADAYVNEISQSLVARVVDEGLVEKLRVDFAANGVPSHQVVG